MGRIYLALFWYSHLTCKSEIHKDFRMKTLLTVTSAGAKLVNISSLIEHPGKLIHLSLRFPTLQVIKGRSEYKCIRFKSDRIILWRCVTKIYSKLLNVPTTHNRTSDRFPSL